MAVGVEGKPVPIPMKHHSLVHPSGREAEGICFGEVKAKELELEFLRVSVEGQRRSPHFGAPGTSPGSLCREVTRYTLPSSLCISGAALLHGANGVLGVL